MIEKIHLNNFQAYEDTTIEPAKSLTSITGRSDQGKTTVIRGVKKVRDNRPLGNKFIRNGEKSAAVTVDDVAIAITGSKTTYVIDKATPLSALNRAVPDQVTERLNLGPDNIQEQHDSIFLLNKSSGAVAQKLSEFTDLKEAQEKLQRLAKIKRTVSSDIEVTKKSIEQNEEIVDELEHIESINERYVEIELKRSSIERLNKKHTQLYTTIKNVTEAKLKLSELPNVRPLLTKLNHLQTEMVELGKMRLGSDKLYKCVRELNEAQENIIPDASHISTYIKKLERLLPKKKELQQAIKAVQGKYKALAAVQDMHDEVQIEWDSYAGESCPLCGGTIDES